MVADDQTKELELRGQSASLQSFMKGREAALIQKEIAQPRLAIAGHGVRKPHIQLQEKHGSDEKILVTPELLVVQQSDPAPIVADVKHEPKLLEHQARPLGEPMALCCHAREDAIDNRFTIEKHAEPAEGRDGADARIFELGQAGGACRISERAAFPGAGDYAFVGTRGRVDHAKVSVASEDEYPT